MLFYGTDLLTVLQRNLEESTDKIREVVEKSLLSYGDTSETCQKQNLLMTLNELMNKINGIQIEDLMEWQKPTKSSSTSRVFGPP